MHRGRSGIGVPVPVRSHFPPALFRAEPTLVPSVPGCRRGFRERIAASLAQLGMVHDARVPGRTANSDLHSAPTFEHPTHKNPGASSKKLAVSAQTPSSFGA